jgi:2-isopropylmalate synthase
MHGFKSRLAALGILPSEEELKRAYERFLEIADRKKEVFDEDLYVLVSDQLGHGAETYTLDYFNIQSGNLAVPTATVRIREGDERHEEAATGDGPVDAIFNAIDRSVGITTRLLEYIVQAVTPGRQAMGEVSVSLEIEGRKLVGRGASTDILEASAKAYVNALNRWRAWQAASTRLSGKEQA